jgi:hypothetical protein
LNPDRKDTHWGKRKRDAGVCAIMPTLLTDLNSNDGGVSATLRRGGRTID